MALKYLHDKKILHRDIKTKNIFVTKAMQIKLGDFGLSKMLDSQVSFAQSAVGTPYYLSPELCEGRPYNQKSDVWALGCVMYELCTLRHAFDATNLPALVMRIVQGHYEPIQTEYSKDVKDLIHRCLRKKPEERPTSEELCSHPLLRAEVARIESQAETYVAGVGAPHRPIFESGRVTTQLQQVSSRVHQQQERTPLEGGDAGGRGPGASGASGPVQSRVDAGASTAEVLTGIGDEEDEFETLLADLRESIPILDRIQNRVPHFRCFVGSDLVTYLIDRFEFANRTDAAQVAQRWMDAGVFYHVTRSEIFNDASDALYRFKEDECGAVLNMKAVFQGAQRRAQDVDRDFRLRLAAVVERHTAEGGCLVDYEGLGTSEEFRDLCQTAVELQKTTLVELGHREKIALFVNLFNALVLHGYAVLGPPTNLYQRIHFFNHTCYTVGGLIYSLSDIEHGILRGNQKPFYSYRRVFESRDERLLNAIVVWDPRIHCALVRGTRTCPALQVYQPETLDHQLDAAARDFCARYVEIRSAPSAGIGPLGRTGSHPPTARTYITLPALLDVYRNDFGGTDVQVLRWIAQYLPEIKRREILDAIRSDSASVTFRAFDWGLNKVTRPAPAPPRVAPTPRRHDSGVPSLTDVPAGATAPLPPGPPPPAGSGGSFSGVGLGVTGQAVRPSRPNKATPGAAQGHGISPPPTGSPASSGPIGQGARASAEAVAPGGAVPVGARSALSAPEAQLAHLALAPSTSAT